jgi:hypothetical protein
MPDRIARELAFELEQAARKQHSEAVAAVGKVYKAAKDEAYRQRDMGFNTLRGRRADLLHMHPRTAEIAAEIAIVEDAMRSFRKSPPAPDLAIIEGARHAALTIADQTLDAELRSIRDRLRAGELDAE